MTQRFTILLAGELTVTDRLRRQIAGSRVIAADGGMAHAAALGVMPELWLGDFDSSDEALVARYAEVPRQPHPVAKNATDGELAVDEALRLGAKDLAAGRWIWRTGRSCLCPPDAAAAAEGTRHPGDGCPAGHEEAWPLLDDSVEVDVAPPSRLSILPVSPTCIGITIEGVRWPLMPSGTLSLVRH